MIPQRERNNFMYCHKKESCVLSKTVGSRERTHRSQRAGVLLQLLSSSWCSPLATSLDRGFGGAVRYSSASLLLLMLPVVLLLGCRSSSPAGSAAESAAAIEPSGPADAVVEIDPESGFAEHAFPPTLSDTDYHRDAWLVLDCMDCHEEGIADAPLVQHRGMPERLLTAQCRTCHVLIPGQTENEVVIRAD
jgi:hypothetical protein